MISKLTIENLKGFATKTAIDLAPLTLLYGENSAGKSTILQALRLLRDINSDSTPGGIRGMPFRDLVRDGNTDLPLSLGFECAFGQREFYAAGLRWLSTIGWDKNDEQPRLNAIETVQEPLSTLHPVFRFTRDGDSLAANLTLPYLPTGLKELSNGLDGQMPAIREGVERLIEARVMQEYLKTHSTEAVELHNAIISAMLRRPRKDADHTSPLGTLIDPQELDTLKLILSVVEPPGVNDPGPLVTGLFEVAERRMADACALLDEWRKDSPDWIAACPAGWVEFKETDAFARESQRLRTTVFSDILSLCDNPKGVNLNATAIRCELSSPPTQELQICECLLNHLRDAMSDPKVVVDSVRSKEGCPVSIRIERRNESFTNFWQAFDAILDQTRREWAWHYATSIDSLTSIKHVPPLREPPQRIYARDASYSSAAMELARSNELVGPVNAWLERLGVDYVVEIHELATGSGYFQVLLTDRRRPDAPAVNYADTGFGVSQLLPILVAGLTGRNNTILVEQPELHIHPRLQAELGSFFAECIKERGHQFIVETHSEHIMLRVQSLLRQKRLCAIHVGVRYVSRTEYGSSVQELRVDDDGDFLDPWPGGFFPERFNEVLHS